MFALAGGVRPACGLQASVWYQGRVPEGRGFSDAIDAALGSAIGAARPHAGDTSPRWMLCHRHPETLSPRHEGQTRRLLAQRTRSPPAITQAGPATTGGCCSPRPLSQRRTCSGQPSHIKAYSWLGCSARPRTITHTWSSRDCVTTYRCLPTATADTSTYAVHATPSDGVSCSPPVTAVRRLPSSSEPWHWLLVEHPCHQLAAVLARTPV